MDKKELDTILRSLVIYAISKSEKITIDSGLEEISACREELEKEMEKAKEKIMKSVKSE